MSKGYPERDRRYYLKHRDKILEREKNRYSLMSPEQKQRRLEIASERRAKRREERLRKLKEEGINHKDKYAKARSLGFRSMFEVKLAEEMDKQNLEYEYESLYIPYVIKGSYRPDFRLPNGIIVEAKGYLDAGVCKKMRAVKASNPELDIRFVFQHANGKRNKRAKLKNWEWAERHGFPWAEGTIPLAWWRE